MSTTFGEGPTRDVQPGDTPDLNDGLLSRKMASENIERGKACFVIGLTGLVTLATQALAAGGHAPFVPIESVDNSGADDLEMSGVTPPQRVAVTIEFEDGITTIHPGTYLKVGETTGRLVAWLIADDPLTKYARFLGIEAGLLDRAGSPNFDETLTPGIVPDQSVTGIDGDTFVGWVQLVENPGGT